ncbi:hypothetical protein L195_g049440 [Trifolium pratense]|uniref:Uncharacterized protein n=2 Tax=Trifolium TaxID=3898 RepID=A0A2K3JP46_TRIPR|nr:hypothetical protein L195_g049440 [Trifolium pratense]
MPLLHEDMAEAVGVAYPTPAYRKLDQAVVVKQEAQLVISPYGKERSSQQDAVGSSGGSKTNESLT